ncbi:DUF5777 family beta-barrel protein [Pedobacter boryungensis]|uniref:DUF5777 domain-containing protein n=1 Tax=Pedobacter boryungensis TaxID=869962 RepID=A0ABX2DCV3_9SPHI|nr:DUF5777 family beta-barrel protein [Pedobacter boryungensis]NQX31921.1 hypothetical protein [Pedobacter boryungensis]
MNKPKLFIYLFLILIVIALRASAQQADSLLNTLGSTSKFNKVEATFKSTHVVLSHSTETQKKHDLDLRIRHHFGDIGGQFGSAHTLYGLDVATDLFIGLDYGITDKLTIGFGRSKHDELYDLYVKQKLLQQKSDGGMPINLTFLAQIGLVAREPFATNEFDNYSDRLTYLIQPIFSRKFSSRLSLQAMPTLLIRSVTTGPDDPKNLFSLGFAGRIKLTKRLSFVADYTLVNGLSRPKDLPIVFYNPLGVGLEIETGGHIFSLNFMNSEYIVENNYIGNTRKSWTDGGVRFGFTISRNFSLFKNKNPDTKSTIY